MGYLDDVTAEVRVWDGERERSQQTEPGWSNMADCRAYLGYLVRGQWPSDDEENWRAIVGTALHEWMTGVRQAACERAGEAAMFSVACEYGGVPGHADEVNMTRDDLTDWKFPTMGSVRVWSDPDVLAEKFVQGQGYAAAMVKAGLLSPQCRVRMLLAPVDGKFADWQMYEADFDQQVADDAIARYAYVKEASARGEMLPRDKPEFWCERFCEFYSDCRGGHTPADWPLITDEETAAALQRYGEVSEVYHEAEKIREQLAPLLRGVRGQARGWRVSMSKDGKPKRVLDEDAVARYFELAGSEVPTTWKPGRASSLLVRREKS